jgi:hypothetical protein
MDELTILFLNFKLSALTSPSAQKSAPKEPNAVRRIPPEIRATICRYVLDLEPLEFEVTVDRNHFAILLSLGGGMYSTCTQG